MLTSFCDLVWICPRHHLKLIMADHAAVLIIFECEDILAVGALLNTARSVRGANNLPQCFLRATGLRILGRNLGLHGLAGGLKVLRGKAVNELNNVLGIVGHHFGGGLIIGGGRVSIFIGLVNKDAE